LVAIVEQDGAVGQRPVGVDRHFGGGAFHRAQIAAGVFHDPSCRSRPDNGK
jgi:hypothetical protein